MSENLDRAAIIATLKREALHDSEHGWLSDLHRRGLEWDDFNEAIMIQRGDGSVDVGHLAEVVEHLIETATKPLVDRAEAAEQALAAYETREALSEPVDLDTLERAVNAEQAVARVRAIREGNVCSGCLDAIDEALDGGDPRADV